MTDDEMLVELVEIFLGNHHNLKQLRCLASEVLDKLPDPNKVELNDKSATFVEKSTALALFANELAHNSECMLKYVESYLPEAVEIAAFAHFPADDMPDFFADLA